MTVAGALPQPAEWGEGRGHVLCRGCQRRQAQGPATDRPEEQRLVKTLHYTNLEQGNTFRKKASFY